MSEKPILFSGEMIRAILDGRKTQTRRIWKKPRRHSNNDVYPVRAAGRFELASGGSCIGETIRCPYGQPGDHLWVRETWSYITLSEGEYTGASDQRRRSKDNVPVAMLYRADAERDGWEREAPWSPSIFMPRWASRITLRVTGVRVERVQEITDIDAMAEGVYEWYMETQYDPESWSCWAPINGSGAVQKFSELWDSINAKRGYPWANNPWVFVIEFERVEQ